MFRSPISRRIASLPIWFSELTISYFVIIKALCLTLRERDEKSVKKKTEAMS